MKKRQDSRGAYGAYDAWKGRVLGITGYFSNGAGSRRVDGFVEELKNGFPDIGLIGVQSSFDHTQEVEKIIVDAMNAYPDLGGIFVASGGQEGVKRAFERLGPETRPYVIIYDLTPKNERYLQEGVVDFLRPGRLPAGHRVSLLADKLRWDKEPAEEYMYTEI
ncbi:MAG: substrate-binding domain-containing protein [Eisenbergiella sp.]